MKFFHGNNSRLNAINYFLSKSSILEIWQGPKYTLSIELLLDKYLQLNEVQRKSKKKFRDI